MFERAFVLLTLFGVVAAAASADSAHNALYTTTYDELVDRDGNVMLPKDFLIKWVFLGTWSVAEKDVERSSDASGHGAAGLHTDWVYIEGYPLLQSQPQK